MVYLVIGILCVIIALLCIKVYLLRKSAEEIRIKFAEKLKTDTNTLIDISSRDKYMCKLAGDINTQLRILRNEHHKYTIGDGEIKTAITNISHDLRTPLTAIFGYLELLKKTERSEEVKKYLEIIENRAKAMGQLTEELFKYSVIRSTEDNGKTENVIINEMLEESIAGFYGTFKDKNITPTIDITEEKVTRVLNRASLSRIFANLLNNAVKYSDGDLMITMKSTGEIVFSNTAKGLSQVCVEKLFDRFFTVEQARNSTGLGLAIARTLAIQIGGELTAEYSEDTLKIILNI